jgi:hypothetical protein
MGRDHVAVCERLTTSWAALKSRGRCKVAGLGYTGQEEALPQGVLNELHAEERERKKNRDDRQHQHDAEGDCALFSSFTSDVPRHAVQCNRARDIGL